MPDFFGKFKYKDWQEFWNIIYEPIEEEQGQFKVKRHRTQEEIEGHLMYYYPEPFSRFRKRQWDHFWSVIFPPKVEVIREGEETILTIDCEEYTRIPSIEDDPITMSKTCELLIEVKGVTKIVFTQKRNYEYDYGQTLLLAEVAKLYNQLTKRKDLFGYGITGNGSADSQIDCFL